MGFFLDLLYLLASGVASVEAKAKALRGGIMRMAFACVLLAAGLLFLLAGLGFLVWGLYAVLAIGAGPIGAAFITGVIVLLIAAVLLIGAKVLTR